MALTRSAHCKLLFFYNSHIAYCQTHKFYGDQDLKIEDAQFAKDIHEYYHNDRKVLLKGNETDYFFFGERSFKKMTSPTFSNLFASTMKEAVGQEIKPQV